MRPQFRVSFLLTTACTLLPACTGLTFRDR